MTKFQIVIDLVATAPFIHTVDIPDYGNCQVSELGESKWDITLDNTVEAETSEDAAATITEELREAFNAIDPDWNAIVYQDDDEPEIQTDFYDAGHDVVEEQPVTLQEKELEMIKNALDRNNNKRKDAAEELGISERTLYRKIKQYNL